ncbi:Fic family protein [Phytoactinopolyspora mesophila]|uniref:Fic family protein n=1 Tax=Phytoactinopolyspora mesophila TaxID=2650750 RepID=A0A7K3M285_9ACTN|nr:Fic family protein [Phytoactinopolyspora mesophila]NDL57415.1 Fic family protein [Phytoactinopolyspora mesophila]
MSTDPHRVPQPDQADQHDVRGGSKASRWPAITYESLGWEPPPDVYMSKNQRRLHTGSYSAAIVPHIAGLHPSVSADVAAEAEEAGREITRFDEYVSRTFGDTEIAPLQSVLLRTESSASSQIENLTVGARQLALAEIGENSSANAAIVAGNVRAMNAAIELAEQNTAASILAMHEAVLNEADAEHAGKWRAQQVWIGGSAYGPHQATFVPPHHSRIEDGIADLISFAGRLDIPPLLQASIVHAQFETIHPFTDGNGRTGRALLHASLQRRGVTTRATVPISAGLLSDTQSYFQALTAYQGGDLDPIVARVAEASYSAITNGRALIENLASIREDWTNRIKARRDAAAWRLRDLVISQPVLSNDVVTDRLNVGWHAAQAAIDTLVEANVLRAAKSGRRNRVWQADEVLAELEAFAQRAGRRVFG